jgi:hypothetical protein
MKTTDTLANMRIEDSVFSWAEGAKEKIDIKLKADIDLAKAKPFAMFFGAMPEKMAIEGLAETELSLRSENGGYRIKTDMGTSLKNLKIMTAGAKKPFEDKSIIVWLDMLVNPEKQELTVKEFKVDGSQIDIEGTIKQSLTKKDQTKVSGKVTAKYDLADVSAVASAYLPEGIEVEGKRSDLFIFESEYPTTDKDKLIENLSASGKFGFERAKYMGMKIGKVDVAVDVKKGLLNIAPFSTSVNNGLLNFAGSVDLSKEPMVFTTPKPMQIIDKVEVDDEMGKALLKYLNPLFAEQTDLSGIASLHCEKFVMPLGGDTAITDAQVIGTVAMSDVMMKNRGLLGMIMSQGLGRTTMNADMLPAKIVLDKGIIRYDNMQMNIDKVYPINFRGGINLNKKPGKFENMFAALPYSLKLRDGGLKSLKVGDNDKGRILLPVKGNIDNPRIDWDEVLKNIGRKAAEDFIQEGLGDFLKKKSKKNGSDGEKSDEEKIIEGILDLF